MDRIYMAAIFLSHHNQSKNLNCCTAVYQIASRINVRNLTTVDLFHRFLIERQLKRCW